MGDQDQRGPVFGAEIEQQIDDGGTGGTVKVASGFVRQQNVGAGHERAREGNALLFAARQFRRVMPHAVRQANDFQFVAGALECLFVIGKFQWRCHIFQCCHIGNQVEGLEHNTHVLTSKAGKLIFAHGTEVMPKGVDAA